MQTDVRYTNIIIDIIEACCHRSHVSVHRGRGHSLVIEALGVQVHSLASPTQGS